MKEPLKPVFCVKISAHFVVPDLGVTTITNLIAYVHKKILENCSVNRMFFFKSVTNYGFNEDLTLQDFN